MGNILILVSLLFALVYLRFNRSLPTRTVTCDRHARARIQQRTAAPPASPRRARAADPRGAAVPGLLDGQRLAAARRDVVHHHVVPAAPEPERLPPGAVQQGGHLVTSLVIALGATAISTVIATPAAFALARFKLPGRSWVIFMALATQMIPGIVIANALYGTYNSVHLINSVPGLVLADASLGIPFSMLLMRSFMGGIPKEILEAARIDGAGQVRAFLQVAVPVARNGIITAALFSFLFAWSDFLFALTLTTTNAVTPITLGIYQYLGAQTEQWSPVMATAVIACIPRPCSLVAAQALHRGRRDRISAVK
jgi:multiple sugar transport system permease protein